MGPIGDFVIPNDDHSEEDDREDSPLPSLSHSRGDESEQAQAIASYYDALVARDRRESYEKEHGRGSSAQDVMLYSFKVPVSRTSLPNRTILTVPSQRTSCKIYLNDD